MIYLTRCKPYVCISEETSYVAAACQPKFTDTNCGDSLGLALRIDSVFFGREDNETCPHESILTLDCPTPAGALVKAKKTCNGRESCLLGASIPQWGDPCPGTNKYFRVEHHCQRKSCIVKPFKLATINVSTFMLVSI